MKLRPIHAVLVLGALLVAPFAGCGLSTYGTLELPKDSCTSASSCDDQNPCTLDECTAAGMCQHTALDDGPTPTQIAGDCVRSVCSAGALVVEPENADIPHAGEACVVGKCSDGEPSSQAIADGTECTQGVARGSCANGGCVVGCDASHPCDDGNACTSDSCDLAASVCKFVPLHGVATPDVALIAGDCRVRRCIDGKDTPVVDDKDTPSTPTDCDEEVCTEGTPTNPPLGAGTGCDTDGGAVCNLAGSCVECNVASDCTGLPADDACQTRTCTAGVCGQSFAPLGTELPQQIAGDCVILECDGQGGTASVADPTDLPNDDNACTTDTCDGLTPVHDPLAKDTPCGTNLVCSGGANSVCQGCNVGTDCPGSDNECKARTCTSGTCGVAYETNDKLLATQTPKDCLERRCDGAGNVKKVSLDSDLPIDGNECTDDVCSNGVASNPPKPSTTTCETGYCDGSAACVQCNVPTQCPAAGTCKERTCDNHVCGTKPVPDNTPTSNQEAGNCKTNVCIGGEPKDVVEAGDIPAGTQCNVGACNGSTPGHSVAKAGAACSESGGNVCDGAGACVGCMVNSDCTSPDTCSANHTCSCVPKSCADLGKTCGMPSNGCGTNLSCGGTKNGSETALDCGGDPNACATRCALGNACSVGGDCASGNCVDGVCCNVACTGSCQACTAALTGSGSDGTCGPIKAGTDPNNECADDGAASCGKDGACDGASACRFYGASTQCAAASCSGASYTPARMCTGTGTCSATSTPTTCASGFTCSGSACGTSCISPATGCATGRYCASGGTSCDLLKPNGAVCANDYQCTSNSCVDGVCCNTACGGLCQACSAAKTGSGTDGICGSIKTGTDPDNECADDGAASCNQNGACDGAGACQLYTVGTECAAASCSDASYTPAGSCTKPGTCTVPSPAACDDGFACNGSVCGTSCTPPKVGCADGAYCAAGMCQDLKAVGEPCDNGDECKSTRCLVVCLL
jgi:hypothetical protein